MPPLDYCYKHHLVVDGKCVLCEREERTMRDQAAQFGGEPEQFEKGTAGYAPCDLSDLQDEIFHWANQHYPNRTYHNAMTKLVMEEVPEVLRNPEDPLEWADAFILLLDAARLQGVDIATAVREKMAINRRRSWKVDPDTGVMRHV